MFACVALFGLFTTVFGLSTIAWLSIVALALAGAADMVSVYVPTTPNPTSGFFLMLPKSDVIPLSMPVDAALRYVVSMGTVPPSSQASPKSNF